jgi:hypothetical protein
MKYRRSISAIEVFVIGALVFAVFYYTLYAPYSDKNRIAKKMVEMGETTTDIDFRWARTGPFWNWRGTRTYQVTTKDGAIYFVRFGTLGGPDLAKKFDTGYEYMPW